MKSTELQVGNLKRQFFFHPDFTVGHGISPCLLSLAG